MNSPEGDAPDLRRHLTTYQKIRLFKKQSSSFVFFKLRVDDDAAVVLNNCWVLIFDWRQSRIDSNKIAKGLVVFSTIDVHLSYITPLLAIRSLV